MMPSAYNENDKLTHISKINSDNRDDKYYCMLCHSEVRPRSINEDNKMLPHFYHLDRSQCTGESVIHRINKDMLFVEEKSFIINIGNKEERHICKEKHVEKSYNTPYGIYRPDTTVITETGETIFVEINYTSKKNIEEYSQKWLYLNKTVVEFDVKQAYQFDITKVSPTFTAIFANGKYLSTYKKQRDNDDYYNEVHQYIQSEKYKSSTKQRLKELEKLDWFWNDLCKYKHNEISSEDLLEDFKYIDYKDMELCYQLIKTRSCCKNIKEIFKPILQENFKNLMIELSRTMAEKFKCKIGMYEISDVSTWICIEQLKNSKFVFSKEIKLVRHYGAPLYSDYLKIKNLIESECDNLKNNIIFMEFKNGNLTSEEVLKKIDFDTIKILEEEYLYKDSEYSYYPSKIYFNNTNKINRIKNYKKHSEFINYMDGKKQHIEYMNSGYNNILNYIKEKSYNLEIAIHNDDYFKIFDCTKNIKDPLIISPNDRFELIDEYCDKIKVMRRNTNISNNLSNIINSIDENYCIKYIDNCYLILEYKNNVVVKTKVEFSDNISLNQNELKTYLYQLLIKYFKCDGNNLECIISFYNSLINEKGCANYR